MSQEDWEWWGTAGHFISWRYCHFRLHTHVKGYCISTIGDYHSAAFPEELSDGYGRTIDKEPVGGGPYLYETMVFKLDENGKTGDEEVQGERYMAGKEAYEGHMRICRQYDEGRTVVAW